MDMRTKLVFALVAVALGSMLVFGTIAYGSAARLMRERALDQIEGVVETKREGLERIAVGWEDRIRLVSSRTQLRASLAEYLRSGSGDALEAINQILDDAVGSAASILRLAIYEPTGAFVASSGEGGEAIEREANDAAKSASDGPVYLGIEGLSSGDLYVSFVTQLVLEGRPLGTLHVRLSVAEVGEMAASINGMGQTGETLIAARDEGGQARLLHSARAEVAPVAPEALGRPDGPVARALNGEEGRYWEGVLNYRGSPVWAATRFIEDLGWGVVVQFDESEQSAPIAGFGRRLVRVGVSLAAFAILFGTLLGLRFAKPIQDLAAVANRIRDGELDARASVQHEDEIGLFARTFNEMTDELEARMRLLREFKAFFDYSVDLLCIAGTDGYFKRVNPAFQRTLGWSDDELLSKPFFDFIHPDDIEATVREVETLSQGIPTISFENRFHCADGSYKSLLWTAHPEPDGTLYSVARDITEIKRLRRQPGAKP